MDGYRIKVFEARPRSHKSSGKNTSGMNEGRQVAALTKEVKRSFPTRDLRSYKEALVGGGINSVGVIPMEARVDLQEQQSQMGVTTVWVVDKEEVIQRDYEEGRSNPISFPTVEMEWRKALEKIHLEKCPNFEGVNIVGGSLQSVGESFATNSNGIGSRNVTDPVLLDVPISLEANIEILGEGTGFSVHEDIGLSGCNPQVQSISHESRLQEVQVGVLEDKALEGISQPVLAEVYGTNKLFGLRAGLDRTFWWVSASKSNKLVKRSSSGKRISKSKSK
ncbi:hypothetical protein V6N13_148621 [Hibiscus sabdariffa]